MGLEHYYDEKLGVWVTKGFMFRREYATDADMYECAERDFEDYLAERNIFTSLAYGLAGLR